MHSPTIFILTLVLGFLTCSDTNVPTSQDQEKPSQVVGQYVSFAHAGEFDKVESLVTSFPSPGGKKSNPEKDSYASPEIKGDELNSGSGADIKVMPDQKVFDSATYNWVTADFARSIQAEKLFIRSVKKESASKTEARVEVILGNENRVNLLGWVFLLRKVDDKWKIYDITTAGE